jgi:hypothetical protein
MSGLDRDDIIRMAREAGMREGESGDWTAADAVLTYPECVYTENLEHFANLVAAAEREACAKLCEEWLHGQWHNQGVMAALMIRARGSDAA